MPLPTRKPAGAPAPKGKVAPASKTAAPPPRPGTKVAAPVAAARGGVSLRPSDATHGGLVDDVNVAIVDAGFFLTNYGKEENEAVPALIVQYETEKVDGGSDPFQFEQIYSAGKATFFVPSEDNSMLLPVGDKTALNDSTNTIKFLVTLVECGFPEDALGDNIKVIIGTKGHVKRVAQPKRTGLLRDRGADGQEKESTTLVFDAITELPEGVGGTVAAPAPAPTRTAAPASRSAVGGKANGAARTPAPAPVEQAGVEADDLDTLAYNCLVEALAPNEPTAKATVPAKIFQLTTKKVAAKEMDTKTKTAVTGRVHQEEFLNALQDNGLIEYDGASITVLA